MAEMLERRPDAYVTNADLDAVVSQLATKAELQAAVSKLATKEELRAAVSKLATKAELDSAVGRLALEIVKVQSDIRDIKQTIGGLSTKADMERIMTAIDSFANKAVSYDNARTLHGHKLTEHSDKLDDHEVRISRLEGKA
jgi:predicted  nucleic acid-binding Zn-ribbon protein